MIDWVNVPIFTYDNFTTYDISCPVISHKIIPNNKLKITEGLS